MRKPRRVCVTGMAGAAPLLSSIRFHPCARTGARISASLSRALAGAQASLLYQHRLPSLATRCPSRGNMNQGRKGRQARPLAHPVALAPSCRADGDATPCLCLLGAYFRRLQPRLDDAKPARLRQAEVGNFHVAGLGCLSYGIGVASRQRRNRWGRSAQGRLVLRPSATMRPTCPRLVTALRQWALFCRRPARRQGRPL